MRKRTKIFVLKISLIGYVLTVAPEIWFKYSDMTNHTDLFSKYALIAGIPALISFSIFLWYIGKIMFGRKVD